MNNNLWLLFSFNSDFISNKKDTKSLSWKKGTLYYQLSPNSTISEDNITIYIKGSVFVDDENPTRYVLDQYKKNGIEFIKDLNGAFLIVIIDNVKESLFLITDHIHSKKAFIQKTDEFLLITDCIFSQIKHDFSVDESSLAQYLTSGFVFNSRTLITDVNLSKASTLYTLNEFVLLEEKYFELKFTNEYSGKDPLLLKQELHQLLKNSIYRRNVDDNKYLSLSGGYDATCIQLLFNEISSKKPHCFSYFSGNFSPFSDAWVAKKQSDLLENKLELILSYNGDFENFIYQNAIKGQGISNISFETNTWDTLKYSYPIYVGEEFFGMRDENTSSFKEILSRQSFFHWDNMDHPDQYFTSGFIKSSSVTLDSDLKAIAKNILDQKSSPFNNQMLLYFNYRLPNVLLNWREFFTGFKNPVEFPLLDKDIILFISKLPYWARKNKSIFKSTLHDIYPDIFNKISRAKKSNDFDWEKIIKQNIDVIQKISSEVSIIDNFIKPKAIKLLIKQNNFKRIHFFIYKVVKHLNRIFRLPFKLYSKYLIPNYIILLRILIVKKFFIEFEKIQKEHKKEWAK